MFATTLGPGAPPHSPNGPVPARDALSPAPAFVEALDSSMDFDRVFRVVRDTTRSVLGLERTGLGLALSDLPPSLGAYWPVTGNLIVLNEGLVETMRLHARTLREFNSFVFVVLAHEYLHALGYLSEREVRPVTARVARVAFGPGHPATRMAEGDMWSMYPFLQQAPSGRGQRLKIVPGFDRASTSNYIR
ncbi:MAG: hypothetical protein L3J95_00985 [Thermoplasmata archaeon]|nr:hypothetical protein [Thermoplasmata archaeon]MCI4358992.1 hypothetical protein [Thermoplasmata archaeon]